MAHEKIEKWPEIIEKDKAYFDKKRSEYRKKISLLIAGFSTTCLSMISIWQTNNLTPDDVLNSSIFLIPIFWAFASLSYIIVLISQSTVHTIKDDLEKEIVNFSPMTILFVILGISIVLTSLLWSYRIGFTLLQTENWPLYPIMIITSLYGVGLIGATTAKSKKDRDKFLNNPEIIRKKGTYALLFSIAMCLIAIYYAWMTVEALHLATLAFLFFMGLTTFSLTLSQWYSSLIYAIKLRKMIKLGQRIIVDDLPDDEVKKAYKEICEIE